MGINGEKFLFLEHELFAKCSELMRQCGTVTCPCVGIHAECAFGAAARAAIFAGVQPSRLILRGGHAMTVCHNSQSASWQSDSGLVMYFSTLPAPSSSAPGILTILSLVLNVPLFVTTQYYIYETKSTFLVFSSQRSFDR